MKCAYDKDRECTNDCTAYLPDETIRRSEYVWDTCLNEYVDKYNMIKHGNFCKRMGHLIGTGKITHKDDDVFGGEINEKRQ